MTFSEFCKPFYDRSHRLNGLKGYITQEEIVIFFLQNALGSTAYQHLDKGTDTFARYFNGSRKVPSSLWKTIRESLEPDYFSVRLSETIQDDCLNRIAEGFGITQETGTKINKFRLSESLTEQFIELAHHDGVCSPIASQIYKLGFKKLNCPLYIKNSYDKFSKIKTLLYQAERQPFYDFFICNTIQPSNNFTHESRKKSESIHDVTPEKLAKSSRYTMLCGMGGIGKSMMI